MSWRHPVTIIGSGCAGLSLAKEIGAQKLGEINLLTDKSCHDRAPHMWGFWQMPWLDDAASQSDHHWQNWQIITCLLYTSPSPRDMRRSRMPSSA